MMEEDFDVFPGPHDNCDSGWTVPSGGTHVEYSINEYYEKDTAATFSDLCLDGNIREKVAEYHKQGHNLVFKVFQSEDGHVFAQEEEFPEMDIAFRRFVRVVTGAYEAWHPCRPTRHVDTPVYKRYTTLEEALIKAKQNGFVGVVLMDDDNEMTLVSNIVSAKTLKSMLAEARKQSCQLACEPMCPISLI